MRLERVFKTGTLRLLARNITVNYQRISVTCHTPSFPHWLDLGNHIHAPLHKLQIRYPRQEDDTTGSR